MKGMIYGWAALVAVGLCGCETLSTGRTTAARQDLGMSQLESRVGRIEGQLQGVCGSQERVDLGLSELRKQQSQQTRQIQADLEALRLELKAMQADRERLRMEITEDLAARMKKVIAAQRPPPVARQSGYEHVVEPGQTLSEIAAAYKVTVKAIVKANKMAAPDRLRVGQKLFIPE